MTPAHFPLELPRQSGVLVFKPGFEQFHGVPNDFALQQRPLPPRKDPTACHDKRQPYNGCEATAGADQDPPVSKGRLLQALVGQPWSCTPDISEGPHRSARGFGCIIPQWYL